MALLGVVPCLLLHLKRDPSAGFWQAAWVTSTFFGSGHTGNNGETWIGIFAAAAIGFVFCVSVWLTGSAWWAIGCHAAWDWGETYFYGTADSGFVAPGHFLTTHRRAIRCGAAERWGRRAAYWLWESFCCCWLCSSSCMGVVRLCIRLRPESNWQARHRAAVFCC